MNPQDKFISTGIVIFILVHLAVWITGCSAGKLVYLISFLNLAVAISILAYRIIKQLNMQRHFFETRKFIVLFFEVNEGKLVRKLAFNIHPENYQVTSKLDYLIQ